MTLPTFRHSASCALVVGLLLVVGCGDVYSDPAGPPDFTVGPNVPTPSELPPPDFDASTSVSSDLLRQCPTNPLEGAACQGAGQTCEVGTSQDLQCDTTLECVPDGTTSQTGTWTARPSTLCPSYACPSNTDAIASIDGTPCNIPQAEAGPAVTDADELVCRMNDGTCACSTGLDAAHHHARVWVCVKPTGGCDVARPRAGSACGTAQICDYGSCDYKHGLRMSCESNVWRTDGATCK